MRTVVQEGDGDVLGVVEEKFFGGRLGGGAVEVDLLGDAAVEEVVGVRNVRCQWAVGSGSGRDADEAVAVVQV